jgi:hypothetical protein
MYIITIAGGWRTLHNEGLHNLYASPNIIRVIKSRRMKWAGHVVRMGEMTNGYKLLVENLDGKRQLGRSMRRWEHNIEMGGGGRRCRVDASSSG